MEKSGSQTVVWEQDFLLLGFQSKTLAELEDIFTETAETQELASGIGDTAEARQWLGTKLRAVAEKAGFPDVLGEALGIVWPTFPSSTLAAPVGRPGQPGDSAPQSHSGTHVALPSLVRCFCLRVRVGLGCHHWWLVGRGKECADPGQGAFLLH